jgi:hypothetical protein
MRSEYHYKLSTAIIQLNLVWTKCYYLVPKKLGTCSIVTVKEESDTADGSRNLCLKVFLIKNLCFILKKRGYIKCKSRQ